MKLTEWIDWRKIKHIKMCPWYLVGMDDPEGYPIRAKAEYKGEVVDLFFKSQEDMEKFCDE